VIELVALDTLRSVEDLSAHADEVKARITELNAEAKGLPFSAEQQAEWAALIDQRDAVEARVKELSARQQYIESMAQASTNVERPAQGTTRRQTSRIPENPRDLAAYRGQVNSVSELPAAYVEGAKKVIDSLDVDAKSQERITGLLRTVDNPGALAERILAASGPAYGRAFGKTVLGQPLSTEERAAMAVYTSSGADGGYAVPVELDPTLIITGNTYVNDLRRIARVETITGKEWQGVATEGITVSRVAENTAVTESTVTLTQPRAVPTAVKGLIKFSIELDQDWTTLQRELGRLFAEAKDNEEATSFTTGTGNGITAPEGIERVADSSIVWTEASGSFGLEDVYAVLGDLPARYQSRASFLANSAIYARIRQFDTTGSSNAWAESLQDDRPGRLLGKPAYEASAMDATITNGNDILIVGDFSNFLIVDRVGMSIELIPHMFNGDGNPTGTRGLWAMWRNTSLILNDNAFRKLRVGEGS
jgi:HK97 family phage major capsid protein